MSVHIKKSLAFVPTLFRYEGMMLGAVSYLEKQDPRFADLISRLSFDWNVVKYAVVQALKVRLRVR